MSNNFSAASTPKGEKVPNFSVASTPEGREKAKRVMKMYAQEGEKQEVTLLRIMDVAEKELIRGTHPALEGSLRSVDATISTLIKQINGIVAGQDGQISELKEKLDQAIEEKRTAIETARMQMSEAQAKTEAADIAIAQAETDSEIFRKKAQAEIDSAKKNADTAIEQANSERDQALRERDDARTISAEKTASNDLLMRQMASMEADVQAHKELRDKYDRLSEEHTSLLSQLADKEREIKAQKKDSENAQSALRADFERQAELTKVQTDLALERALNAQEKKIRAEYQDQIRMNDKENAKLTVQNEQLRTEVEQLQEKIIQFQTEIKRLTDNDNGQKI